jgi:hypothetical protein
MAPPEISFTASSFWEKGGAPAFASAGKQMPLVAYVLPMLLSSPTGGVARLGSKGRVHRELQRGSNGVHAVVPSS